MPECRRKLTMHQLSRSVPEPKNRLADTFQAPLGSIARASVSVEFSTAQSRRIALDAINVFENVFQALRRIVSKRHGDDPGRDLPSAVASRPAPAANQPFDQAFRRVEARARRA